MIRKSLKFLLRPSRHQIKENALLFKETYNIKKSGTFSQVHIDATDEDYEAFQKNPYLWSKKKDLLKKIQQIKPGSFRTSIFNDNVEEVHSRYCFLWNSIFKNGNFLPVYLLDEKILQEIIHMQDTGDLTSLKKPNRGIGKAIRSAIIPIISSLNKKIPHSYPKRSVVLKLKLKRDIPLNDVYQSLNILFKQFPETRVPGSDLVVEIDGKQFTCATILGVVEFDDNINNSHTRIQYSNKTTDKHLLDQGYITFFIEKKDNTFLFYLEGKGTGILPLSNEKIGDPLMHYLLENIKNHVSDIYN